MLLQTPCYQLTRRVLLALLGFTLLFGFPEGARAAGVDSLLNVVNDPSQSEMVRKRAHLQWIRESMRFNPDSLHPLVDPLLDYFVAEQDSPFIAKANYVKGIGLYLLGDYEGSTPFLEQSARFFLAVGDTAEACHSIAILGDLYRALGRYEEAQQLLIYSIKMLEPLGDKATLAGAEFALGNFYFTVKKFEEGLKIYRKGYQHNMEEGRILGAAKNLAGMANCENGLENHESSLNYTRQAISLMKPVATPGELCLEYYNMGDAFQFLEQLDSSKYYFQKSLEFARKSQVTSHILWGHFGLTKHYIRVEDLPSARSQLEQAQALIDPNQNPVLQDQIWLLEMEVAELSGDFELAYEILEKKNSLKDSLLNQDKVKTIEELTVKYQTELKEAENNNLRSQNELYEQKQNGILIISITVASILLLAATIFFLLYRRMQGLNGKLQDTIQERDALMGIVAHDLKSPLNKVGALIQAMDEAALLEPVHKRFTHKMEQAISQGGTLIGELESIAELERRTTRRLTPVDLHELVDHVVESYQVLASRKSTTLRVISEVGDCQIGNHGESLDRILGNLISNAIKFSPSGTKVNVLLTATTTHAQVTIIDQGPGIPAAEIPLLFRKFARLSPRPTAGESSTGLGLYIVKLLASQIKGSISVDSTLGKGTRFKLEFPRMD